VARSSSRCSTRATTGARTSPTRAALPRRGRCSQHAAREALARQIEQCLCFTRRERRGPARRLPSCAHDAKRLADRFLAKLPSCAAAHHGRAGRHGRRPGGVASTRSSSRTPGCSRSRCTASRTSSGAMGVPLMPRIMTEWAHAQQTAPTSTRARRSGPSFFIDHATGVVVGETTHRREREALPGRHARRALHPKDEHGPRDPRHQAAPHGRGQRHPLRQRHRARRQHDVGAGSVLGGSVFLTKSVPPGSRVAMKPPELNLKTSAPPADAPAPADDI
jgi:serine O-acetyltransferase